jgi:hypothetical protein
MTRSRSSQRSGSSLSAAAGDLVRISATWHAITGSSLFSDSKGRCLSRQDALCGDALSVLFVSAWLTLMAPVV